MTKRLPVLILLLSLPAFVLPGQTPDPAAAGAPPQSAADPVLIQRPPPSPEASAGFFPEGRIKLDVEVTDAAGNPATGLEPLDFKLMDNGRPRKILSFRVFDGVNTRPDPPVEAILVIDTANLPFQQVAFVRLEVERYLRRNGGHLAQPVSVMLLTDAGLRVQPRPSTDGNALAGVVEQIKGNIRTIDASMGGEGLLERFQLSAHEVETIAENEALRPGRKLLIWVGPGWPMLNHSELGYYSPKNQQRYFDAIVELSTKLREARMVVYSVSPANLGAGGSDSTYTLLYQTYLKGVQSASQAEAGDLALKVLVTQTGGRILGPDNDLAAQIDRCMADANSFYRISFNPPPAMHGDEYHGLQVEIDKPGLTARTNSGYYDQPEDAGSAKAGGVKAQ
jgi:VWFA-related protein